MTVSRKGYAIVSAGEVLSFHETIDGAKKTINIHRYFGVQCNIAYAERHHETIGWPNVRYTINGYYYEDGKIY